MMRKISGEERVERHKRQVIHKERGGEGGLLPSTLKRRGVNAAEKEIPNLNDNTTENMTERYGDHDYWNERYELSDCPFDWMCSYDDLAPNLRMLLPSAHTMPSILVVGCGDAPFSADLYLDGYRNTLNVDYSDVVIRKQRGRFPFLENNFQVMNCLDMKEIDDDTFGENVLSFILIQKRNLHTELTMNTCTLFLRRGH